MQHFPLDTSEYSCEVLPCSKSEPHDVHIGEVHVQMLLSLFEQLLRLYLPYKCMRLHFRAPIKMPVTLLEHCILPARFKNTMIELLKTSSDIQTSKEFDSENINLLQFIITERNFQL